MTMQLMNPSPANGEHSSSRLPAHVVVLMNFVPPHRVPILSELARRVERLTLLLSTPMEPNRTWIAEWGDLNVQMQRTFTLRHSWRHSAGFTDDNYVHVPWDTVSRLRSLKPDVIVAGQLGARSILSTCYHMLSRKTRLVFWVGMSEHTERGRSRARTLVRKGLLRQCQGVVVNGHSGVRYLESLGVDATRIFRCPYATTSHFHDLGSGTRPSDVAHRLLYVGQFVERKGLLPFLEVLRTWGNSHPDRHIDFDLIGGGPLKQAITEFSLPANVRLQLLGNRPYEELPNIYANAGILAFPTLADDWGMVVNEALAAGMPVLGSVYAQAVEDLCIDGANGWRFRPDVADEMQISLETAMNTPVDELNAMRRAARETASALTPKSAADVLYQAVERAYEER